MPEREFFESKPVSPDSDEMRWVKIGLKEVMSLTGLKRQEVIDSFTDEYCQDVNGKIIMMDKNADFYRGLLNTVLPALERSQALEIINKGFHLELKNDEAHIISVSRNKSGTPSDAWWIGLNYSDFHNDIYLFL
jgi:hypothetical protein